MRQTSIAAAALMLCVACGDDPLLPEPAGSPADTGPVDVTAPADVPVVEDVAHDGDLPETPVEDGEGQSEDTAGTDTLDTLDPVDPVPPPCPEPVVFEPDGEPTGWKHTSTRLFTVTQGKANHRGQDVVVAGGPQRLIGKFAYGVLDKDLKQEDVEVFIQPDPPCGEWVSFGVVETSDDGQNGTLWGVEDDGGRVFFELPAEAALPPGWYPVRMLVHGDHSVAAFSLVVVSPGVDVVVSDIDGTLTTDDFQLVTELFGDIFSGAYEPDLYPSGADVMWAWQKKGVLLVYLTGRPDFLKRMTRETLTSNGFPPGVMHLTDTNTQAFPTSSGVAAYKTAFLERLQEEAQVGLRAAYGNASTDLEAYANLGIPKEATFIIGKHAGEDGTVSLEAGFAAHLPTVEAEAPAAVHAPSLIEWFVR